MADKQGHARNAVEEMNVSTDVMRKRSPRTIRTFHPPPRPVLGLEVNVRIDIEEMWHKLQPNQIAAVMNGLAQVIASGKPKT